MTEPNRPSHIAAPDVNPSFTKGVFLGELREEFVFPFPRLSPEDRESLSMILGSFRGYAAEHIDARRNDRRRLARGQRHGVEAARALGVQTGTSKAQLFRARARLREALADFARE